MKRASLILSVFLLSFMIEIKLKASHKAKSESPVFSSVVSEPVDCARLHRFPCAIQVDKNKTWFWQWDTGRVELGPNAIAQLNQEGEVLLISGYLILYSQMGSAWVKTSYGDVAVSEGQVMVDRRPSGDFEVNSLQGEVAIYPRGGASIALPAGYRNWLGPVRENGLATLGIPQASNREIIFKLWPKLYAGDKKVYLDIIHQYYESWQLAVETAGQLHQVLVERGLASLAEKRRLSAVRKARIERENREMRELFRRKNYLD